MIPEEHQQRRLAAVAAAETVREEGPKPYLDIVLARARLQVIAWLSLAGLAVAEATVLVAGSVGTVMYGILTLLFLVVGGRVASRRLRMLLWALSVVPTSRLVAFGAPLGELPSEARLGLVGALTLLATVVAIRATGLTRVELGLTAHWRHLPLVVAMAIVGLGLGVIERALVGVPTFGEAAGIWLLATIGALAVVDDLLFQGLIFEMSRRVVGRFAVPFVALLVAALHVTSGSAALVGCAFVAALLFGWVRLGTGSLGGVVVGHLALNVGIFVLGPDLAPRLTPLISPFAASLGSDLIGLLAPAAGRLAGV